ncbi:hypothetical protein BHM03_00054019 [Ensete ventricosum]|nr:hypothetical protein BHM03_00054019 [Ensete ventricosum]
MFDLHLLNSDLEYRETSFYDLYDFSHNLNLLHDNLIRMGNQFCSKEDGQPTPMQGRPPIARPRPRRPTRGLPAMARASPYGRLMPLAGAAARKGGRRRSRG